MNLTMYEPDELRELIWACTSDTTKRPFQRFVAQAQQGAQLYGNSLVWCSSGGSIHFEGRLVAESTLTTELGDVTSPTFIMGTMGVLQLWHDLFAYFREQICRI